MQRYLKSLSFAGAALAAGIVVSAPTLAEAQEIPIASLTYRTGAFAPSGIPVADGFADYIALINERDGGLNGATLKNMECETEYKTDRGVECYERLKAQGANLFAPYSTGITYALIDRAAEDKSVIHSMAYGRADSSDGEAFPWVFTMPTTYWAGANAMVQHIGNELGGMDKLKDANVAYVYIDIAYGKEAIPILENYSEEYGFKLTTLPVAWPGLEQKATWGQVRQLRPDYVILWGWGAMNAIAIKEAAAFGIPREKMLGIWWSTQDSDIQAAGDAAKGYRGLSFHGVTADLKILSDIKTHVVDKGKGSQDGKHWGEIGYLRGALNAAIFVEAYRNAQDQHSVKVPDGDQLRDGFESMDLSEAKLEELGLTGFLAPMKLSCSNHMGDGNIIVVEWDGSGWQHVSDWIRPDERLWDRYRENAGAYLKEKGQERRDCS